MADEREPQPVGGTDVERQVRPACSHCGFPLPSSGRGLRHYGTHSAHQEYECLSLLRAEIDRASAEAAANFIRAREWAESAGRLEAERDRLRDELAEWHKLRDPVNLHVNLLRGIPAQMTREQIWHLVADDRDRLADLEQLAMHESDCAEAFKAEAAALRALVQNIADKRHTYGWGPEADAAIEAARAALKDKP